MSDDRAEALADYQQQLHDRIQSLEAEVARYREALEKYGTHVEILTGPNVDDTCAVMMGEDCTCGLSEVLGDE